MIDDYKQKAKEPVKIECAHHHSEKPSPLIEEEKKSDHQAEDHSDDHKSFDWPHLGCFDVGEIG